MSSKLFAFNVAQTMMPSGATGELEAQYSATEQMWVDNGGVVAASYYCSFRIGAGVRASCYTFPDGSNCGTPPTSYTGAGWVCDRS